LKSYDLPIFIYVKANDEICVKEVTIEVVDEIKELKSILATNPLEKPTRINVEESRFMEVNFLMV